MPQAPLPKGRQGAQGDRILNHKALKLETAHLTLRPLGPAFLHGTFAYAGSAENTRCMLFLPSPSPDETAQFLRKAEGKWQKAKPAYYEFAICFGERHIGAISLYLEETGRKAELGWIIHRVFWGHDYALEAARRVADSAHKERGICRPFQGRLWRYRVLMRYSAKLSVQVSLLFE